ncbi:hypothetical protein HPB50_011391 [Hyalomma asiaticum]|uniref:Uncharacterized protein n=1 Tax=Hyalomma asiaticum TaxID=266040 RepID=A0ACB7S5G1_HYAAI|nr:hypothetical protein HPB50_011391 [Hyalomma asiaticum]
MSSAPRAITNDVLLCNDGKATSSGCPAPMFAATARVIGRRLQKRYVLRPGARCRVNMSVRRRTAVLVRGGVFLRDVTTSASNIVTFVLFPNLALGLDCPRLPGVEVASLLLTLVGGGCLGADYHMVLVDEVPSLIGFRYLPTQPVVPVIWLALQVRQKGLHSCSAGPPEDRCVPTAGSARYQPGAPPCQSSDR